NLGHRLGSVLSGASMMARWAGAEEAILSPLYETVPVGGPPQGDFINAALTFKTNLSAGTLLTMALAIEQRHGRVRVERFGPRTLDIDVLWIEGEIIDQAGLQVPHPRLLERAFALRPMLDLVPTAVDPATRLPYEASMALLSVCGLRKLDRSSRLRMHELSPSFEAAALP
ncbi:MAG TPA: 2-amino-4-hydroxy-6-hydroxymethyldihydropteridine diphosphokinase, partial [Polyangiaceae bacterium]|nr:2-amino-4-hydroxy-6-hydroxymethyldihydropteridine diphosphokinase [Polyangiaceae bacterium]